MSKSTKFRIARSKILQNKVSILRIIPSILTIIALSMAVTGIKYALDGKFVFAVTSILIATIFDTLDGRVARMLNVSSSFGAQFDSLSDLGSFGISPGIIMYIWSIDMGAGHREMMWFAIIVYISCVALRLARFNIESTAQDDSLSSEEDFNIYDRLIAGGYFFNGVPSTFAAILLLTPIIVTFEILSIQAKFIAPLIIPYIMSISAIMLCKLPTISLKRVKIEGKYLSLLLFMVVLFVMLLLIEPWIIIPCIAIAYFISIPVTLFFYKKISNKITAAKSYSAKE